MRTLQVFMATGGPARFNLREESYWFRHDSCRLSNHVEEKTPDGYYIDHDESGARRSEHVVQGIVPNHQFSQ